MPSVACCGDVRGSKRADWPGTHEMPLGGIRNTLSKQWTMIRHPLKLSLGLAFLIASGATPALADGASGCSGPCVALYLHHPVSAVSPIGGAAVVHAMDLVPPRRPGGGVGAHYEPVGQPGTDSALHLQWASVPLSTLGFSSGLDLARFRFEVWVFATVPGGAQPGGLAELHVDLYRLIPGEPASLLGSASSALPLMTLNWMTMLSGEARATTALGPEDGLLADVYLTGVRTSVIDLTYDDRQYDSGIVLYAA